MAHPLRFQLSRKKGYRKPEGAVVVSRPSKWGNPFKVGVDGDAGECVELFREYMDKQLASGQVNRVQFLWALQGRQLGCWCKLDRPCHADALCELANP